MTIQDDELLASIERLIHEKTFTLEGLNAIKNVKDRVVKLESDNEAQEAKIKLLYEQLSNAHAESQDLRNKNKVLSDEVLGLKHLRSKFDELLMGQKIAEARHMGVIEALGLIMRNTTVKEVMMRNLVMPGSNGSYPYTTQATDTKETIHE